MINIDFLNVTIILVGQKQGYHNVGNFYSQFFFKKLFFDNTFSYNTNVNHEIFKYEYLPLCV